MTDEKIKSTKAPPMKRATPPAKTANKGVKAPPMKRASKLQDWPFPSQPPAKVEPSTKVEVAPDMDLEVKQSSTVPNTWWNRLKSYLYF